MATLKGIALVVNSASDIVHGGGGKTGDLENVKVKAWIALFAAILLGGISPSQIQHGSMPGSRQR